MRSPWLRGLAGGDEGLDPAADLGVLMAIQISRDLPVPFDRGLVPRRGLIEAFLPPSDRAIDELLHLGDRPRHHLVRLASHRVDLPRNLLRGFDGFRYFLCIHPRDDKRIITALSTRAQPVTSKLPT